MVQSPAADLLPLICFWFVPYVPGLGPMEGRRGPGLVMSFLKDLSSSCSFPSWP